MMLFARSRSCRLAFSLLTFTALAGVARAQGEIKLASFDTTGVSANQASLEPSLSADGRFLVFSSTATDLVANDNNGDRDIFLFDRLFGTVERVNLVGGSSEIDGSSSNPKVSFDSRFVAFRCSAVGISGAPVSTNDADLFLRDRIFHTTTCLTIGIDGNEANETVTLTDMTPDARFFVIETTASNLVVGDTNGTVGGMDVFVIDRTLGTIDRVSVQTGGGEVDGPCSGGSISSDGHYVVFSSRGNELVPADTNAKEDVFVHDRFTNDTWRISVGPGFTQTTFDSYGARISRDGRSAFFNSAAPNLAPGDVNNAGDIFVHDLATQTNQFLLVGMGGVQPPFGGVDVTSVSADGMRVAFWGWSTSITAGDTNNTSDAWVFDRRTGQSSIVSLTSTGAYGTMDSAHFGSWEPELSADGRTVAFRSSMVDLVPADQNGWDDVFAFRFDIATPIIYCPAKKSSNGCSSTLTFTGSPSASAGSGFDITVAGLRNQKQGMFFYGKSGSNSIPFQGGTYCVKPPTKRFPVQSSGGSSLPTQDCSGSVTTDFNARIASGVDPQLVAGQEVFLQYWSRDPGFAPPNNTNLSPAVMFEIGS
jgi:hypothetical protein